MRNSICDRCGVGIPDRPRHAGVVRIYPSPDSDWNVDNTGWDLCTRCWASAVRPAIERAVLAHDRAMSDSEKRRRYDAWYEIVRAEWTTIGRIARERLILHVLGEDEIGIGEIEVRLVDQLRTSECPDPLVSCLTLNLYPHLMRLVDSGRVVREKAMTVGGSMRWFYRRPLPAPLEGPIADLDRTFREGGGPTDPDGTLGP